MAQALGDCKIACFRLLVAHGAGTGMESRGAPLLLAVALGSWEAVEALLVGGADPGAIAPDGRCRMYLALK